MAQASMKLSDVEKAALLKCRYAGRYDNLTDPHRVPATPEEAAEEQATSNVIVPYEVFRRLERLELISGHSGRLRLTDKGRAALIDRAAET